MKKLLLVPVFLFLGLAFVNLASAASLADIKFPIQELGNCADKEQCKEYCQIDENREVCLDFAENNGLMGKDEVERAKKIPKTGPGGCDSPRACEEYCKDPNNHETCIKFAQDNGFLSSAEAERARKFKDQTGPGGCKGVECRDYCDKKDNRKACFEFAKQNGLISEKEAAFTEEVIERGGPGGCESDEECRTYCDEQDHLEECLAFAESHNLISSDEAAKIRQFGVEGPGGCRKQECKEYCSNPNNQEECINFAVEKGFMTKEEAEKSRKFFNSTGPGGCRGEECRTYCDNPDRVEECLTFAEKEGFMPKEEVERARKFLRASQEGGPGGCKGVECRDYCESESRRDECFNFAREKGLLTAEEAQNFEVGRKLHEKLKEAGGPGGCKSEEECRAYCSDSTRAEECIAYAATHGGLSDEQARKMLEQFSANKARVKGDFEGVKRFEAETNKRFEEFKEIEGRFSRPAEGFSGPGGCKSPEECRAYCSEHLEECINEGPPPGREGNIPQEIRKNMQPMDRKPPMQPFEERREEGRGQESNMRGPMPGVGDFEGPGGCRTPEECKKICLENPQKCMEAFPQSQNRGGDSNLPPNQFDQQRQLEDQKRQLEEQLRKLNLPPEQIQGDAGPGGCMDELACANFCEANPEECDAFERRFQGSGFEG